MPSFKNYVIYQIFLIYTCTFIHLSLALPCTFSLFLFYVNLHTFSSCCLTCMLLLICVHANRLILVSIVFIWYFFWPTDLALYNKSPINCILDVYHPLNIPFSRSILWTFYQNMIFSHTLVFDLFIFSHTLMFDWFMETHWSNCVLC